MCGRSATSPARAAFTHVSMYQADIVVNDILGRRVVPADYRAVPRVTFTDPEISSVGLSERDARAGHRGAGGDPGSGVGPGVDPQGRKPGVHQAGRGRRRGVLIGATSAGPWGGEVLGLLTLAVYAEVPTVRLRHMIYAYPTFHRAVEAASRTSPRVAVTPSGPGPPDASAP